MNKAQIFIVEYDNVLEKWVVFAKIQSVRFQVDTLTKKQVGNWFKKIKKEEKKK